jgi:hypothetical protein
MPKHPGTGHSVYFPTGDHRFPASAWFSLPLGLIQILGESQKSATIMPGRRFPPPWSVEEQDACFVVRDHSEVGYRNRLPFWW